MRIKLLSLAMLLLTASSCEKGFFNPTQIKSDATKHFEFHVKGDFATNYDDLTKATVRLEENNSAKLTDLWILDYSDDGTLIQEKHQSSSDEDFGHPSLDLTYGSHSIKFIASKGTEPVKTSEAISWTKVSDTFVLDYPVEVKTSSNGNRAPELKRAISGVTLINTDAVPTNAKEVQITIVKRFSSLTLPGLIGGNEDEYTNTFEYLADERGQAGLKFNVYTLCPSDEPFAVDVRVKVVALDGSTLTSFGVKDVELKKNRKTTLTGAVFNRSEGFSTAIDDAWDAANEIDF